MLFGLRKDGNEVMGPCKTNQIPWDFDKKVTVIRVINKKKGGNEVMGPCNTNQILEIRWDFPDM